MTATDIAAAIDRVDRADDGTIPDLDLVLNQFHW